MEDKVEEHRATSCLENLRDEIKVIRTVGNSAEILRIHGQIPALTFAKFWDL